MQTAQKILNTAREHGADSIQLILAVEEACMQRDMLYEALQRLKTVAEGARWLRRKGDAIEGAESALTFVNTVGNDPDAFTPYRPPNHGDGPIDNAARDICFRVHGNGAPTVVTPQVVACIAWLFEWGHLSLKERKTVLDGLGLMHKEDRMGGTRLVPRQDGDA